MKLITNPKDLKKEFERLIKNYANFYWATAWASPDSELLKALCTKKNKIKELVVGIHFYQTHPDFIEHFLENDKVRFIEQPNGTFHPKLYLFTDDKQSKWELIIGSANFTAEAFSRNTEACLLITQGDSNAVIYKKAKKFISKAFKDGKIFNKKDLENYRKTWEKHMPKIESLSGTYGYKKRKPKPIHNIPVMNMNWDEFMDLVKKKETLDRVDERIKVIEIAKTLFNKEKHFKDLTVDERKFIAGIYNKLGVKGEKIWGYFGTMVGAGIFMKKIIENDENISNALDEIPLTEQITKQHYEKFIKHFTKAFSLNYIAPATRLLCMKRPDVFICFNSKNRSKLRKDFAIQSKVDYKMYWEGIIAKIFDSNWWQYPDPKDDREKKISEARAAFLDSLYYEP